MRRTPYQIAADQLVLLHKRTSEILAALEQRKDLRDLPVCELEQANDLLSVALHKIAKAPNPEQRRQMRKDAREWWEHNARRQEAKES